MKKALLRQSERIYELILRFYPRSYSQQFGEEMKYVFSESLKDTYSKQGEKGIINLWGRTIIDACKSLFIEHLDSQKGGGTMKGKHTKDIMQNNIIRVALGTAILLLVPLIGNFAVQGWNWSLIDFIVMGVLIFSTGFVYVVISERVDKKYRIIVAIVLLGIFLTIWAELAVDAVSQTLNWLF